MEIVECCTFRVTRDADFEVSDEADDLLEAVQDELATPALRRRRPRRGLGLGLERMLERLERGLHASRDQIYLIQGLLDLAELQELVRLDRPDLKDEAWFPVVHPRFAAPTDADELFAEIRRNDILVHHPFDSFASSFEAFLLAAVARSASSH